MSASQAAIANNSSSSSSYRSSLPAPLTSFVGRDRDTADLHRLLATARLVTVAGPPGIGKTRLALHVAASLGADFPAGVFLADLSALVDETLVARSVAATLGVRELPGRSLVDSMIEHVAGGRLLLILDNCEHLVASCAALAGDLLAACPGLRILSTSRLPLGLSGETTYRLPPLSEAESAQLFIDRARAAHSGLDLRGPAVVQICRQLEGIPLAIELAAVWVRALSLEQVAARLGDRWCLLADASRQTPARHPTLRNAIEWSYDLLADDERALFNRLAVFAGGWSLDAAETVCADDALTRPAILPLLARLVDCSLVVVDQSATEARYRLLETLRDYAAERLLEAGEDAALRERHRAWCLTLAEQGEHDIWQAQQLECVRRLEREHDNFRAALTWTLASVATGSDPSPGLRIAAALARFWDTQRDIREATRWLRQLLALPGVQPCTLAWVRAMTAYGYLASVEGDSPRAVSLLDAVLACLRQAGDPRALAVATFFRGAAVGWPDGDLGALPWFEQALDQPRTAGLAAR